MFYDHFLARHWAHFSAQALGDFTADTTPLAEIAAARAAKEAKAAEGERRKIAEAEKQQRKQADHDARVAKKMREAEQRAAQSVEKK